MHKNFIYYIILGQKDQHKFFLIVLVRMLAAFACLTREERNKVHSYDYMYHLNNLKVAKSPLPLPGHFEHLWKDVLKIIDSLHIANHKDTQCKELYNPEKLKSEHPEMNTMCCEQTFAWLSRYKRILSSMPKTHHHFYLHRMMTLRRRNTYSSRTVLPTRSKTSGSSRQKTHHQ